MIDDLRHALRHLRCKLAATATVVVILALGIGASLTSYALGEAVLLQRLPYPEADRLVAMYESNAGLSIPQMLASWPSVRSWQEEVETLDRIVPFNTARPVTLGGEAGVEPPVRLESNFVGDGYFELLGARAHRGRLFDEDEHWPPLAHPVAVVSHRLWQGRFGGGDDLVGSTVRINETPVTIVGIVEPGFHDLSAAGHPTEVWLPLTMYGINGYDWERQIDRRLTRWLQVVARLAPSADLYQARAELAGIAERLESEFPDSHSGYLTVAETLRSNLMGDFAPSMVALAVASFLLLLIGCANTGSLLLVQAAARRGELAVQMALGLDRARLFRQLLCEGLAIAALAALGGMALAWMGTAVLLRHSPVPLPDFVELGFDPGVVAVAMGVAAACGLVFALVPLLEARKTRLSDALHDAGRGAGVSTGGTLRRAVVVAEVATAVMLLVGAVLLMRSLERFSSRSAGFDSAGLVAVRTDLPAVRYGEDPPRQAVAERLQAGIAAEPGIAEVAVWSPQVPGQAQWYSSYVPEGRAIASLSDALVARFHLVSPGALRVVGLRLLAGRGIEAGDRADSRKVVVISESAARSLFPGEDPLGRRIHRYRNDAAEGEPDYVTVVGVVADAMLGGRTDSAANPHDLYFPYQQISRPEIVLLVRPGVASLEVAGAARAAVGRVDPDLAVYDVRPMTERLRDEEDVPRFVTFLVATFAFVALAFAALGLYGVLAYVVRAQRKEVGIRLALGGTPARIVRALGRQAALLVLVGLVVGLPAGSLLSRLLRGVLVEVEPFSLAVYGTVALVLALVAGLATLAPLVRAARIDPVIVLRGS